MHKPDWIGGYFWAKILKDCMFKYRVSSSNEDFYFNESHIQSQGQYHSFSFENAMQELTKFRNNHNSWEQVRAQMIQGMNGLQI